MSVRLKEGVEGRVRWEAMFWSSRGSERREVTGERGKGWGGWEASGYSQERGELGNAMAVQLWSPLECMSNTAKSYSRVLLTGHSIQINSKKFPRSDLSRPKSQWSQILVRLQWATGAQSTKHTNQPTHCTSQDAFLEWMRSWMASYLGQTVLFKSKPAWAARLHIAAAEHAKTYINGSSDVVPFCISDRQVFYVTALRRPVFHKEVLSELWLTHIHKLFRLGDEHWANCQRTLDGRAAERWKELSGRGVVTAWPTHVDKHIKVSPSVYKCRLRLKDCMKYPSVW